MATTSGSFAKGLWESWSEVTGHRSAPATRVMSQDDGDSRTCNRRCGSGHVVPDLGWHTRELAVGIRAGALAGLMVVVASLSGCIAPDVEVIGALGVTVDEEQRPVAVVEASAP